MSILWLMAADPEATSDAPDILRLFPTFVWSRRLRPAVYEPIHVSVRATLGELRQGRPPLAPGEAWQSGHALHRRAELAALVAQIRRAAADVLGFLKIGSGALEVTGCWANVNAPGAPHRMHTHPNNFLSGAYYVQVAGGADTINFHDPRPQTAIVRPPVTELTGYNTDQVVLPVTPGTLILFPAWLPHSVAPNASARERISVSFNLMFAAYAETMSPPLWGEP
ncbi:MAG TPA: 2OG-Fe(II) oxygenase family protein [Methylomirabilota bacterium]|nr:2OG-Fe(II) oxygenase family protein [Methylomirabilota bacterium]